MEELLKIADNESKPCFVRDEARSIGYMFAESIAKYRLLDNTDTLLFLFSGGKDATFGLTMMTEYINEKGLDINVQALMIAYPRHVYFTSDRNKHPAFADCIGYWNGKGVCMEIICPDEDDIDGYRSSGCKTCKRVRMKEVTAFLDNTIFQKERVTIVTGYTLFDAVAYVQEIGLITDFTYQTDKIQDSAEKNRMLNYLHKIRMHESLPGGQKIIRPLLPFKESTIRHYLEDRMIPYINVPCKVADYKTKRLAFKTFDEMSGKINITYEGLIDFLEKQNVSFPQDFYDISTPFNFTDC